MNGIDRRGALALGLAAGSGFFAGPARAAYPDRLITLIVPYAPGGLGTTFGNFVSEHLSQGLGQRVIVDYKPGANGGLGAAMVAKAPPDGYTLLMAVNSTMAINPNLYEKPGYDPIRDFTPVAMVYTSSNILVVNPKSPFHSVKDVIAAARAQPGKLTYGSSGHGGTPHLSGEMFNLLAKVETTHVPYKGAGPAMIDVMGGQIDMIFGDTSSLPHIAAGKLRGLAVTGARRLGAAPDLPTMEEEGLPGFVVTTWYSLMAPAGTPADAVERIGREVARFLALPAARARMRDIAVDPAEDTSPKYLESVLRSDLAKWRRFIGEKGIRIN
ncbi:Bug family tripartite tricarboxylate transporter substrate binding protein [Piscinibacter koreensis]|uniref:Tripartite tricarboxylate transporter substrate binding protein n=1 Tax=Piscinibacter koreensis TaxID=2742824 RepID=A0A7Y6TWG0_9BURK|nr:tripartite tricarboxylate transporter substrate binding protein [Schlegelella koreensis]NUZ06094.1 tripartite tricarboxylate transporter substrate binding protein [Schlegelella koreensis]